MRLPRDELGKQLEKRRWHVYRNIRSSTVISTMTLPGREPQRPLPGWMMDVSAMNPSHYAEYKDLNDYLRKKPDIQCSPLHPNLHHLYFFYALISPFLLETQYSRRFNSSIFGNYINLINEIGSERNADIQCSPSPKASPPPELFFIPRFPFLLETQ